LWILLYNIAKKLTSVLLNCTKHIAQKPDTSPAHYLHLAFFYAILLVCRGNPKTKREYTANTCCAFFFFFFKLAPAAACAPRDTGIPLKFYLGVRHLGTGALLPPKPMDAPHSLREFG